ITHSAAAPAVLCSAPRCTSLALCCPHPAAPAHLPGAILSGASPGQSAARAISPAPLHACRTIIRCCWPLAAPTPAPDQVAGTPRLPQLPPNQTQPVFLRLLLGLLAPPPRCKRDRAKNLSTTLC